MSEALQRVLDRLRGVKHSANGSYKAHCPVVGHGKGRSDLDPSLSVKEGDDGRVLINCLAGCSTEAVVGALGLKMGDLFEHRNGRRGGEGASIPSNESAYVDTGCTVEDYAKAKGLPPDQQPHPACPLRLHCSGPLATNLGAQTGGQPIM